MEEVFVDNRAGEIPLAGILEGLLRENLARSPAKRATFRRMRGAVAISLADIEAEVTLLFSGGKLRIEPGCVGRPGLVIRTTSDRVMDLNALRVVGGLPWYLDGAGRTVLLHLVTGRLKIDGMFAHPVLLTRLTKVMSVL